MRKIFESMATVALLGSAACTHQMNVTPSFSPSAVAKPRGGNICPNGEVVAVAAENRAPGGNSAGTTSAGIHTFNYQFDRDPALTLKSGLEQALTAGGCRVAGSASAKLGVTIVGIEARGLSCGFFSCDGKGTTVVEATLSSSDGQKLLKDTITANTTKGCGMTICNEKEASEMAEVILSDAISQTIAAVAKAIAKQLSAPPAAPAPTPAAVSANTRS